MSKEYSNYLLQKLQLEEVNRQFDAYLNKFDQKYRVKIPQNDLEFYTQTFTDINKSYLYYGMNEQDLRQLGCYFLYHFPRRFYGVGNPKSVRTDYKSIFGQDLLDSKYGDKQNVEELPTNFFDNNSSFIIVYVVSEFTQYQKGESYLLEFLQRRYSVQKPVLVLSLIKLPSLESSEYIDFKTRSYSKNTFFVPKKSVSESSKSSKSTSSYDKQSYDKQQSLVKSMIVPKKKDRKI